MPSGAARAGRHHSAAFSDESEITFYTSRGIEAPRTLTLASILRGWVDPEVGASLTR